MKYKVMRTDTADAAIRKIILYVAQVFGNNAALKKLDETEKRIWFFIKMMRSVELYTKNSIEFFVMDGFIKIPRSGCRKEKIIKQKARSKVHIFNRNVQEDARQDRESL